MIGNKLGIVINYTQRLGTVLVNRANDLRTKMKGLSGGAPKRKFFQKEWSLNLELTEIVTHERVQLAERIQLAENKAQQLQEQVTTLESERHVLQAEVQRTSEKFRKACARTGIKRE